MAFNSLEEGDEEVERHRKTVTNGMRIWQWINVNSSLIFVEINSSHLEQTPAHVC